jgi:Flp pilus assembly protein TadD
MENQISLANQLFKEGKIKESFSIAVSLLDENNNDIDVLLLMAKIYYKNQECGEALNLLNKVLDIEPDNVLALNYKKMITDILKFRHTDLYNP